MQKIIYTAIYGGYDSLSNPIKQDGWRYICFTDQDLTSNSWEIIKLENTEDNKRCREVKILPHKYLPEHDISIWIDGNLDFSTDFNELIQGKTYCLMDHPERHNIYQESEACISLGKDDPEIIRAQINRYRAEYYTADGLVATGLIIRKDTPENRKVDEDWWREVKNGSRRDQLSFNYVAHKNNLEYQTVPWMYRMTKRSHVNAPH